MTTAARDPSMDMRIIEATAALLHPTGIGNTMIEMTLKPNEITAVAVGVGVGAVIEVVRLQKRGLQVEGSPARRLYWRA
jgi:hypothetical protein